MHPVCSKHFHPVCGRRNGLRMEWVANEGLQAFCDKHGKKKKTRSASTSTTSRRARVVASDREDSYQDGEE